MTAAYVDEIAVERACWGDRVRLRAHERHLAVERLTRQGRSASQIAELHHSEDRAAN